jgi:aliphatic nitrilase
MKSEFMKIRLAAVQAAPVVLNRDASVEKACRLIREAGEQKADVIGFPEGFIPTHPNWLNYLPPSGTKSLLLSRELFKNAVEIPSPATDRLQQACRDANVVAVIGMCERRADTTGTLWNTQLYIDRTGEILGKHQKLVPTHGERLVHTGGRDMFGPVQTHFGPLSALMCGENSNPLAAFTLALGYPVVHVASWPAHFGQTHQMLDSILAATCGLAYQLKAYVINSASIVTDEMIDTYVVTEEDRAYLKQTQSTGCACIIGPKGKVVAGPMGGGEGILYHDVDTQDLIIPKLMHDFAGHYNRSDIFQVSVAADGSSLPRFEASAAHRPSLIPPTREQLEGGGGARHLLAGRSEDDKRDI